MRCSLANAEGRKTNGHKRAAVAVGSGDNGPN